MFECYEPLELRRVGLTRGRDRLKASEIELGDLNDEIGALD